MESRHRFDQKSRPYGKIRGRSAADRKDPQSSLREVASYLLLLASTSEIAIEAASRSFGAAGSAITAPEQLHPCPIMSGHPNNDPGYPSRPDVDLRIIFVPLRIVASYSCSWISSRGSKAASSDTSSGRDGPSRGTRARATSFGNQARSSGSTPVNIKRDLKARGLSTISPPCAFSGVDRVFPKAFRSSNTAPCAGTPFRSSPDQAGGIRRSAVRLSIRAKYTMRNISLGP
jgi:hypothetical protein